jgi:hypothetical protein
VLNIEGNTPNMAGNDTTQEPHSIVITFPDSPHVFIVGYHILREMELRLLD